MTREEVLKKLAGWKSPKLLDWPSNADGVILAQSWLDKDKELEELKRLWYKVFEVDNNCSDEDEFLQGIFPIIIKARQLLEIRKRRDQCQN